MAVIDITQFGGEIPSASPRVLPAGFAQVNSNLHLNLAEFRPTKVAAAVATCANNTKTLYRFARKADGTFNSDPTTGWITSTSERSYVKGQIDDERTERTYTTFDDGSAKPRVVDVTGQDRVLGVPRAVKPVVTLNITDEFTPDEANSFLYEQVSAAIRNAVFNNYETVEPHPRRINSTMYGGPSSTYGMLFSDNTLVSSAGFSSRVADLWLVIPAARVAVLKLTEQTIGGVFLDNGDLLTFITCVPWTVRIKQDAIVAALQAIVYPPESGSSAGQPVFTSAQATQFATTLQERVSPALVARSEKARLDALAKSFTEILLTSEIEPSDDDADILAAHDNAAKAQRQAYDTTVAVEDAMRAALKQVVESSVPANDFLSSIGGVSLLTAPIVSRVVESRFYVVTMVTDWGEESAPSAVSDLLELDQNDSATISRPALVTAESYASRNIEKWRIYRTNSGAPSAPFQFIDEVSVSAASYTDTKQGSELGELCPTASWAEPPYRMDLQSSTDPKPPVGSNPYLRGLVGMPNGIMAGFYDNTVAFCEPYAPYAWPVEYQITTEFPIVGLGVFGQTLFVGTTSSPYFIYGADSASMTAQKLESNQSCASRRSIASVQGGVLYASPDGLCVASQAGVSVATAGLYTREDWQALQPSTMYAIEHESIYYLFYSGSGGGCLTFDLSTKKLGRTSLPATAAYVDRVADILYVASGTTISSAFGGSTLRTGVWKSGVITLPAQNQFVWLKVLGDQDQTIPATIKWYADGQLRHTSVVTGIDPVRLPVGRWLEHELEVESSARITRVTMTSSTQELQSI